MTTSASELSSTEEGTTGGFAVRLDNFEGPFDLLLSLISKHKMDVTEVALSQVTDEFIAHIKAAGEVWDLEQTTSFLLVASTLLDLKAARLLPAGDIEDEDEAFKKLRMAWPLGHLGRVFGVRREELEKMPRAAASVLIDLRSGSATGELERLFVGAQVKMAVARVRA